MWACNTIESKKYISKLFFCYKSNPTSSLIVLLITLQQQGRPLLIYRRGKDLWVREVLDSIPQLTPPLPTSDTCAYIYTLHTQTRIYMLSAKTNLFSRLVVSIWIISFGEEQ